MFDELTQGMTRTNASLTSRTQQLQGLKREEAERLIAREEERRACIEDALSVWDRFDLLLKKPKTV
jgi:hypothetical protein